MIPEAFIQEIQQKIDIVEVISDYLPLKKAGRNFKALCPFHGEKTPSFIISPQKQIFHCFGCGEGGGVFQFLMLTEKITFPEAVEMLARRLGVEVPYRRNRQDKEKALLFEACDKAALFFHENLNTGRKRREIMQYLHKRGIGPKTIEKFCIGYAEGGNSLLNYMRKSGVTLGILEKASLVVPGKNGFYDVFRDRITFPIFDLRSRVVGFGARTRKDEKGVPKYINSPESSIYNKRDHLFGLNLAKEDVLRQDTVIIVEGYLDAITPFMRGVKNIAASLGTALTEEQVKLIKRYASRVILVYDSDKAGQNAALRSSELLLENDLEVKIVELPEGEDPDSLCRKGDRDLFLRRVKEQKDFFEYKLDILKKLYDSESIDGKTKIAKEMFKAIDKLNSEIKKYEYIRKLAASLKVKEEIMIAEFRNIFSREKKTYSSRGRAGVRKSRQLDIEKDPLAVTERVLLRFMLTNQKAFNVVKNNLKEEYFSSYLARKTVRFLFDNGFSAVKGGGNPIFRTEENKEISSFIAKILIDDDYPLNSIIFKDSLLKLRRVGVKRQKEKLKEEIKKAESSGDSHRVKELIKAYETIKRN